MFSASDSDRLTADGPVGRFITHGPVGPDRILSTCDPDQPVDVGPVDQPFATGLVGTHVRVSDYKRMDRIDDSPVGSTGILDPVEQTGSPIQTDFVKTGTVDEPASLGDTRPSSDSGVHSLGEQWENMSTNSMDMESEQIGWLSWMTIYPDRPPGLEKLSISALCNSRTPRVSRGWNGYGLLVFPPGRK